MGAKQLRRDVKALLDEYIGQKLRENSFDPKGKETSTILDNLAHYDLIGSTALWWIDKEEGRDNLSSWTINPSASSLYYKGLEQKALILSSFAGMLLNSLPVEEILALYGSKPAAVHTNPLSKGSIVCNFTLSYHPLAMLASYKAVHHSRRHYEKFKRWLSERVKPKPLPRQVSMKSSSSSSSSSHSFLSASRCSPEGTPQHYEGSQDSLKD